MRALVFGLLAVIVGTTSFAQEQDIVVHDPVLQEVDGKYYLFSTGNGISVWRSDDLKNWQAEPAVFSEPPLWAKEQIPSFKGHIWAPDISYYQGRYYLFYSVSAFGKNTSCIGLATNITLDRDDPNFHWEDHGLIIQSFPGVTNWNAIDPNMVLDEGGNPYLVFGSFWGGLQLVKLRQDALAVADTLKHPLKTIASRKKDPALPNPLAIENNPVDAGGNAIEAPFIYRHEGYFYLFASIDYCCKGKESTYKMIVGRSKVAEGPYVDERGVDMARGGGKLLLQGDERWHGVGHNAVVNIKGVDYILFHAYDGNDNGKPKLRLSELSWNKSGWPEIN